jgi:hypothetical protein
MAMGAILLLPGANDYPASNPATPDVLNAVTVLDFDASTDESVFWTFVMPQTYAGGTLTAYVYYTMSSATSGNVVLQVALEAIADGESAASDSFDTVNNSGQVAVPGTAGLLDVASITLTNKDSVNAGERVRCRLNRDADSTTATDDAAGDLELHAVEIRES